VRRPRYDDQALAAHARRYRILGAPGDAEASDHAGIEVAFYFPIAPNQSQART